MIAILEDNAERIAEMRGCLHEELPEYESIFFQNAAEMIAWLGESLADVVLISLDHDLPLTDQAGQSIDNGTGRQVADFLATMPPCCPVIVHSSNQHFAPGMMFALKDAGWQCVQVFPFEDNRWIRRDWIERVKRCLSK